MNDRPRKEDLVCPFHDDTKDCIKAVKDRVDKNSVILNRLIILIVVDLLLTGADLIKHFHILKYLIS